MSQPISLLSLNSLGSRSMPMPVRNQPRVRFLPNQPNRNADERSPTAISKPIRFAPEYRKESELFRLGWHSAPARVHHRLDDITDYYRPGTYGWETSQKKRLLERERDIGRGLERRGVIVVRYSPREYAERARIHMEWQKKVLEDESKKSDSGCFVKDEIKEDGNEEKKGEEEEEKEDDSEEEEEDSEEEDSKEEDSEKEEEEDDSEDENEADDKEEEDGGS
ncbi:hypothetical protein P153DRAFT_429841 [Dothidotthia symphoricarpi CBS 119687]|uniref:Uncharacterized protein n=1 Tax=Dothidotthia symphoricarpi CBS 119687 TaxID=1392245 RepID=A0A6A6AL28_9PLEO|nr:uncharacterized protein P153DRAFT_429841 [Dothidotthia symphoricarpi CBS 119687]KAF2131577.1 hypothetical protein P153DRAFT_429841 [Dothidotthia symphoricarpi CBS 119687]